jgi:(p)ppGpp synthase/HD superfamily hydrolase
MTPREFAIKAHGDKRYGVHPYVFHLDQVHAVLEEFGCDNPAILSAAYLHDILEDTDTNPVSLQTAFGTEIAMIVSRVTSRPGKNRKERNRATYPIIIMAPSSIMLKLADRIANARESQANSPGLFQMYLKEYAEFRQALTTNASDVAAMWDELDRLMR